ncbi:MAG TPA: class A beta-lactamase-related serine hydrolase [Bacteroidetes bacterium]|nr:class A beta-lactamase-related serine hydrolase [Bacteroidota bacterium]
MYQFIFILFFLFLFQSCETKNKTNLSIESARLIVKEFIKKNKVPGLSISVSKGGMLIWSEGFGYSDLEHKIPVKPDQTKFRIGSVSKPVTAAAIGILYEKGIIGLDDNINKYVPSFPEKRGPISIRHLTSHLSGIRHYRGNEFFMSMHYNTVTEGLSIFREDTLLYLPGSKFSYTSYGWNLVSAVIEGAGNRPFLDFMNENVFIPLNMDHTIADYNDSIIENRTRFYMYNADSDVINASYVDNSYKWAGGGFLSTTEDLIRFGNAYLKAGFHKQETLDTMLNKQRTLYGEEVDYGIGWRIKTDDKGRSWFGHRGGSVGGSSQFIIYKDAELIIAILTNISKLKYNNTHFRIADCFLPTEDIDFRP